MFQWLTILLGIAAIVSMGVGLNEVSRFNNDCTAAGIPLAKCWPQQIKETYFKEKTPR